MRVGTGRSFSPGSGPPYRQTEEINPVGPNTEVVGHWLEERNRFIVESLQIGQKNEGYEKKFSYLR